ncbi:Alpha/Beta hydrolase protein [Ilyonectria destructans]|nr:Alpha/Beta hydrolase protein [Ilyonectria destructans]
MSSSIIREAGTAKVSPEWEAFEKQFPIPSLLGTLEQLRQIKFRKDDSTPVGFSIKEVKVTGYQGATNQVRIYTPDERPGALPVVIYVHGGGWVVGDLDSEDKVCQTICKSSGVVVVSVDYRKAPENPFPIPLEDVWEGVRWVFNHVDSLGGDKDKIIIGGFSAGGNISAVLAQRARDTKNISLRGQILRNPLVVHTSALPSDADFSSYTENANASVLPVAAVTQCLDFYGPSPEDIRISPLLAKDLSGLPPTYVQIAGTDPLRDDGYIYAEKLQKAGVPVKVNVYPGLPHGFMNFPLLTARKSDEDLLKAIKWLIEGN